MLTLNGKNLVNLWEGIIFQREGFIAQQYKLISFNYEDFSCEKTRVVLFKLVLNKASSLLHVYKHIFCRIQSIITLEK